ncbi:anthocyanidin 3-o-glucoside 2''-o-glucosyltransferase [Phtheirospermum japonicum]|uniref:Anthocyanidin 3-o-glucoside 2''-o-glucosyltransferase n=1 Tax=Phtheirospermum japonicum TaxID=374723 RepID=A0A830CES0_9LAMI|nr:anthocyanidin 3-o-glucoside 2''-o-glucosyltransferase [Phtheirospermum japonicum]
MGFLFAEGPLTEGGPPGYPSSIKLYRHTDRAFKYFETRKEIGSGLTMKQRLMTSICECDAIGFKTCREIEGPYCQFLENKLNKPILLAGPMVPKPRSSTLDKIWANWLVKFKPETVVFCCFGSEAVLSKDQFEELLLGFELTNFPFLIALRPPMEFDTIEEAMPIGFKERTKERGIVHGGWVPQQLILKHPSVGTFVTHCGYGSMWEGLMSHCRLVVLPHVADQYIHARLMSADLRVAVEVEKGDEDGLFTKEGVCRAIMAVMADDSWIGKEVRENHDKWTKFLSSDGLEDACFNNFVDDLCTLN